MTNELRFSFSPDSIDFDATKNQLEGILERSDLWSGVITNQVGTAMIDYLATLNVFAQQRIKACFQEVFPETLANDRSAFALAHFQGVRLTRNTPATCTVELTSPEPVSIPPFTKFVASGNLALFNRNQIFLQQNVPQEVVLAEGSLKFLQVSGLGTDFQAIVPLERDFVVSDQDVAVEVDGVNIPRVVEGLWNYRLQEAFQDSTLPDGRLLIRFGTTIFGTRPSSGSSVLVGYALTRGSEGNSLGAADETVNCPGYNFVRGRMQVALSGGADRRSALEYKNVESPNFGSFGSAVKKAQYVSTALQYPKVVDVRTFAQREVDPTDVQWMNLIKLVPLVQSGWNIADEAGLIRYMEENTMYQTRFYVEYPIARPVDVNIRATCSRWANPTTIRNSIIDAINALFVMERGILERDLFLSTISDAVAGASTDILNFDIIRPRNNVIVSTTPVNAPVLVPEAGVGGLAPGLYLYGIAAVVAQNEEGLLGYLKMTNSTSITVVEADSSVIIRWDPIPNATEYHIFGRTTAQGGFGRIHTFVPTELESATNDTLQWTDDGSNPIGDLPLTKSNIQIQYVTLNSLNVTVNVSRK